MGGCFSPEASDAWRGYKLILGSSSRFRRQCFEEFFPGVEYDAMSPDIDEKSIRDPCAERLVALISSAKADALVDKIPKDQPSLLICMDQVVRVNGEICEKPADEKEALARLAEYDRGTPGECVNGMCVVNTKTGERLVEVQNGCVWLKKMDAAARRRIVDRKIIYDCAGGISIGEDPDCLVDRMDCDKDVIIGLPVRRLKQMLTHLARNTQPSPPPNMDTIPQITHCLFDMDGLVLDTESIYTQVQNQIAAAVGKEFTWDLKARIMGMKGVDACTLICKELGLNETGEELYERRAQMLMEEFTKAELMPGAEDLLLHLKGNGVGIALATSSERRTYLKKISRHTQLFSLFDHIFTGNMVTNGKPNPEIFLKAQNAFSPVPSSKQCLVFEDAPMGVEAGLNANMMVVHIPDERLEAAHRGKATIELKGLAEFDPAMFGLPPRSMPITE